MSLLGLYSSIRGLSLFGELPLLLIIIFVISLIINLITLYIGTKFYSLIQTNSDLLIKFFWFVILWTLANAIYLYAVRLANAGIFIFYGIGVLIDLVIISNIRKLAKENSGQP